MPFEVFQNCVWPAHARIAIGVRVTAKPSRTQVERLLRGLWDQSKAVLGKDFPRVAQVCAFEGPGEWSPDFLGCLNRGFEPEAEDDETGDAGEEQPELENRAPLGPAEEVQRIQGLLGSTTRVSYDEGARSFEIRASCGPTTECADGLAGFFRAAWTFYPAVTDVKSLVYRCARGTQVLLEVRVPSEEAFLAMDPWPLRERLQTTKPRALIRELRTALSRLPKGRWRVDPKLCHL